MADLDKIVALAEEAKVLYENGEITKEEFAEILEDIKRAESVEDLSDDMEMKGKILMALDIATYVV
jgi:acyl-[acyl carrier protein]--UDP-N-acetylglucosamine O-acyltransferase